MELAGSPEKSGGLTDWIPFFQSLLWPIVLVAFVFLFRRSISDLLKHLSERVRDGAPLEVAGVKIGGGERPRELVEKGENPAAPAELPNTIYMTHRAVRDTGLDRGSERYFRLIISLDADTPELLDQVERVRYHLHPTFRNPVREVSDRGLNFQITTTAWGEFNMKAEVYLKNKSAALEIERYINF